MRATAASSGLPSKINTFKQIIQSNTCVFPSSISHASGMGASDLDCLKASNKLLETNLQIRSQRRISDMIVGLY